MCGSGNLGNQSSMLNSLNFMVHPLMICTIYLQPLTPGGLSTYETIPFTFDPTADFHGMLKSFWCKNSDL